MPVSLFYRQDSTLIYFDVEKIKDMENVEKAYLLIAGDKEEQFNDEIHCNLNQYLTEEEWEKCSSLHEKTEFHAKEKNKVYIDITVKFQAIALGIVKNRGLILSEIGCPIDHCEIHLIYINGVGQSCYKSSFYEQELIVSSTQGRSKSSWILTKNSQVITFFIKNSLTYEITVHLENSPNARDFLNDTRMITILPGKISLIMPYAFSKYTRVAVTSDHHCILAKIWFQTQRVSNDR